MSLATNDPIVGYIKWISAIAIVTLPWLFLRLKIRDARIALWFVWMVSIIALTSLYLGFLTYNYIGIQFGFKHQGNPMDWFMIITGIISIIPFILAAKNGSLSKPKRTAVLAAVAMLIVMGPAIYNAVAFNIYLQGGGDFDPGEGDYAGEVYTPTKPDAWAQAGNIALFVCNLVPAIIFMGIWWLNRHANPNNIRKDGIDSSAKVETKCIEQ